MNHKELTNPAHQCRLKPRRYAGERTFPRSNGFGVTPDTSRCPSHMSGLPPFCRINQNSRLVSHDCLTETSMSFIRRTKDYWVGAYGPPAVFAIPKSAYTVVSSCRAVNHS